MKTKFGWIDALSIALFILAVYLILTRIFGHSATDITIGITLFAILTNLLYKLNREFGEFKVKTIYSFDKIKKDISDMKEKMTKIEGNINEIKNIVKKN